MVNEKGMLEKFRSEFYKRVDKLCRKDVAVNIKLACVEVMLEVLAEDEPMTIIPVSGKKPVKRNNKIGDVL